MKHVKKGMALLLILAMVLIMGVPALAAGGEGQYTITLTNDPTHSGTTIEGNAYTAYKLFDVTYVGSDSDQAAGPDTAHSYTVSQDFQEFSYKSENGKAYKGEKLIRYVAAQQANGAELNRIAAQALEYAKDPVHPMQNYKTETACKEKVTIDVTEFGPGYYLVAGTATTPDQQQITAACALDTTNPNAEVQVKVAAPTIDQVIIKADSTKPAGGDGTGTAVNVGEQVEFKLLSKVPNTTGYNTYLFEVHERLSAGLTPVQTEAAPMDVTVKIGTQTLTMDDYSITAGAAGETFVLGMNLKKLEQQQKAKTGDTIEITYAAILNQEALKTSEETSKAHLEYTNDPYSSTKGKTPDSTVYIYDFDVVIDKYEKDQEKTKLPGAEFVLYQTERDEALDTNKQYYQWDEEQNAVTWTSEEQAATKMTTDQMGQAKFVGLDAGTYFLQETKAPAGYNKLAEPIKVNITAVYQADGKVQNVTYTTYAGAEISSNISVKPNGTQISATVKVENSTGAELPSTGGMGTKIFYVVGGVMMLVAAVLLITKKKMAAKQK